MSNLSELLPSGGGQNVVEFTADGAISAGDAVALQSDGTVTDIINITSPGVGTPVAFDTTAAGATAITFDSSNSKTVIIYSDSGNSSYGTAVVGTVSGTSISFGTPVVFESASTTGLSAAFDTTSNKVVVAYSDSGNSGYGTAVVGTVSGTSISFGTPVVFEAATTAYTASTYSASDDKTIISYRDGGNSNYGTSVVGTVSGTSISFGTPVVFETGHAAYIKSTFDTSSNKLVVAYDDVDNGFFGTSVVGTVSGTSISFGTPVVFESSFVIRNSITFDSNSNKIVLSYIANSVEASAVVGTVSGTSISFGSSTLFASNVGSNINSTFDTGINKVHIGYPNAGSSNRGEVITGTVSGTSISFGTAVVFDSDSSNSISLTFDSSNLKTVIAYQDSGSVYGTAVVFFDSYTNISDFIGLAAEAISDTATGNVNVKGGINEVQTGLTIGSDYYVQTDGTLATTADTPSVKVGQAISATTINMMDLT